MSILQNGIVMDPGKELDVYANARGLCRLCGQTQTHRKVGKFLKRLRNDWRPLTVQDEESGRYLVYKGYCIQPTCYSLDQAKVKLGETPERRASDSGSTASLRMSSRLPGHPSSPLKAKARRNSGRASDMSSTLSFTSAWNGSDEEGSHGRMSLVSGLTMSSRFDVPASVDATSNKASALSLQDAIEAFLVDPKQNVLDLSGIQLSDGKISTVRKSLQDQRLSNRKLNTLLAERCKLNDTRLTKLAESLMEGSFPLSKLVLRSNILESVQGLISLLQSSTHLRELNLSKNRLGDDGVRTVFSALVANTSTPIAKLDLSSNQIWTLSDSVVAFLSSNQTLETLHLENNFLRDAGVALVARAIAKNADTALHTLCLDNNAFGYLASRSLSNMLVKNTSIRALRIGTNELGDREGKILLKALGTNTTLQEVSGLYANRIESKELLTSIEICLKERAEEQLSNAIVPVNSESANQDSITEITFCDEADDLECISPVSAGLAEEETTKKTSAVELNIDEYCASSNSSACSEDDEMSDVNSTDMPWIETFEQVPEALNISLSNIEPATDVPDASIRSSGFRTALEALNLTSPSQHLRLVPGSRQGVGELTTVCLSASGQEQDGFETVALPLSEMKASDFEATDIGVEVSFDETRFNTSTVELETEKRTPPTRFELENAIESCKEAISDLKRHDDRASKREQKRTKKRLETLVSLRSSMPTKQELEQKVYELDSALMKINGARDTAGSRRQQLEADRSKYQELLDAEIRSETAYDKGRNKAHVNAKQPQSLGHASQTVLFQHEGNKQAPSYRLTLFQAAPLSFVDQKSGVRHNFPLLDFEYESRVLKQSLKDAERMGMCIEVEKEIATTDRLSAFFAQGGRRVLHLSCHGHPSWLALENGFGDMQPLFVEDLRGFIAAGGTSIDFVFISACHSLPAGRAFLEAGVRHVVCAKQDSKFRDEACAEFTRCFYRALACKKTLKQAFKMAREAVRVSPLVKNAKIESDKFMLLPEQSDDGRYHDVHISFADMRPRESVSRPIQKPRSFTRVPSTFVGREGDIYRILEALRWADLVQVCGSQGTGRSTIVAAVVEYILQRHKSFLMDDVVWLNDHQDARADNSSANLLKKCFDMLGAGKVSIKHSSAYKEIRIRLLDEMHGKRSLLVIDGRELALRAVRDLEILLKDLLQMLPAKIVLIGNTPVNAKIPSRTIEVGPLDHETSSLLFSRLVHSSRYPPTELAKILAPIKPATEVSYPLKRNAIVFESLGQGLPAEIVHIAAQMSERELLELVRVAKRPCPQVATRVELEEEVKNRLTEESIALRRKHFLRARDIRESIEELQGLRQYLRTNEDLTIEAFALRERLEAATKARQYDIADDIQKRLELLEGQIREENRAQEKTKEDLFDKASARAKKIRSKMRQDGKRN